MNDHIEKILKHIQEIETYWNFPIPQAYQTILVKVFTSQSIIEVTDDENYWISFYDSAQLLERNQTYTIQDEAPEYLMVGQDGDTGYFISAQAQDFNLYALGLGALGSLPFEIFSDDYRIVICLD